MNIFFIKLGGNSGFVVTEYSDGSVKMTATNGAGIGVEFPPGAGAEAGGKKGGASVDFGGGLVYGWGSTWNFSSMAEAEAFRKQFDAYRNQWPWENKPAPRPPDETVTSIKVNAEVEGELGIGAGKGKANVEGSGTWTTRTKVDQTPDNGKDDTLTTYTTDLSIKGGAEGNIVNITFVSTAEGSLKGGQKGKVESTKPKGSAGSKGSAEVGDGRERDLPRRSGSRRGAPPRAVHELHHRHRRYWRWHVRVLANGRQSAHNCKDALDDVAPRGSRGNDEGEQR